MPTLLRFALKAVLLVATILGIIFFAKDASELPDALKAWNPLIPGRFSIMAALCVALSGWLCWVEIRPAILDYYNNKFGSSIKFQRNIFVDTNYLNIDDSEDRLYKNNYYIIVYNNSISGKTLRNVSVQIHSIHPIARCYLRNSDEVSTDIRSGSCALFCLGYVVMRNSKGSWTGPWQPDESDLISYKHNVPQGYLLFELGSFEGRGGFSGNGKESDPVVWSLGVTIVADDERPVYSPLNVKLSFDDVVVSFAPVAKG